MVTPGIALNLLKSKPGVQGGVGRRAGSAALAKGYTKDQIEAEMRHLAGVDNDDSDFEVVK